MNRLKTSLFVIAIVVCGTVYCQQNQSVINKITVSEAEQMLIERNPALQIATLEEEAAKSALQQERRFENPEVDFLYNVYNPLTGRYFDPSREGETYIAIEQPIPIGGQRRQRIGRQSALAEMSGHERQWTAYQLKMELHRTLADIHFLHQKTAVYDDEIRSVERILTAYRQQEAQGNLSKMDLIRMEAVKLQLANEQNDWLTQTEQRKNDLRLILGMRQYAPFGVDLDENGILNDLTNIASLSEQIGASRPDMLALQSARQAAEHDLRLQRANALPNLSVKAEYDKNGNICRDFWGIGMKLSLPVFDRNQGNIKVAQAMLRQSEIEEEALKNKVNAEISLCRDKLLRQLSLLHDARSTAAAAFTPEGIERRLLSHDISLLEFISIYEAYRDTQLLLIDDRNAVIQSAIDLNEAYGEEIINIR